ncbi:hypothetical protein MMC07_008058 [Pseudocyphellaria aurata]|nr:hypothetical protein [Pseudocyphellaria aurata]
MDSPAPFDPFSQSFTLLLSDSTPFNVSIADLDDFILYNIQICINYGAQLGGSLVLLIALLLLTKPDKRLTPIFILNSISLLLNVIRNVLQCLYFTGPFSEAYAYFGQDYSRVPRSAYATSVAATVLTFLLLVCVESSLILQVRVVCVTLPRFHRQVIFTLSNVIALLAIGFRFALCVENSRYIISLIYLTQIKWLESGANITTTISVCWFCAVFVSKLAFALMERRKLGLDHFGPMQIIFIMGCQTLIIPAIFSMLQYFTLIPAMSSNVLTAVTIFLPLSSLWASANMSTRTQPTSVPSTPASKSTRFSLKKFFSNSSSSGSAGPLITHKIFEGPLSPSGTVMTRFSNSSIPMHGDILRDDLEKQDLADPLSRGGKRGLR